MDERAFWSSKGARLALSFDISTSTGWALLGDTGSGSEIFLIEHGLLKETRDPEMGYPESFLEAAFRMAKKISQVYVSASICTVPLFVVIEETNQGKNRYSQKLIEWIHCLTLRLLWHESCPFDHIHYVNSSDWRRHLKVKPTSNDRASNKKLSQAKSKAKAKGAKLDKTSLGIKGRVTNKHLSVRYVNDRFGLNFKLKDNDTADAICIGAAYLEGVPLCTGK
jgi:hypothetical protein